MVSKSFISTGIVNDFDSSEDKYFTFSTHISDYIDDHLANEQMNKSDKDNFISDGINNNKYNLKTIRDKVILENRDIIYDYGFTNIESDSLKNYDYYSTFGFI